VQLGSDLEVHIWMIAAKVYGASFPDLLNQAITQYKRAPGLDDLTRLHKATVGSEIFYTLKSVLADAASVGVPNHDGYIEVRHRLRWHVLSYLQRRLLDDGYATATMRDDLLGTDLGL
jgi:hypothetical protein